MFPHHLRRFAIDRQSVRPPVRRRRLPWVEALEHRLLLSGNPTVYTVDNTASGYVGTSSTSGSLLDVISLADGNSNPAGSVIEFDPTVFSTGQTITLTQTLVLSETPGPEMIAGPRTTPVTISGDDAVEVFNVSNPATVADLSNLIVADGSVVSNGGGISNAGLLTITDCTISGNSATLAINGRGGGIYNAQGSQLTVTDCTISRNSSAYGGGVWNAGTLTISGCAIVANSVVSSNFYAGGGGVANVDQLTMFNCTVSGNSSLGPGGGVYTDSTTTLTVTNCTIAGNSADLGGGIYSTRGAAILNNTIVALNSDGAGFGPDEVNGPVAVSGAYDLIGIGNSGGLVGGTNGNQVGVANPGLGTLAYNGGPTETIALLPGSPAIDMGNNSLIPAGIDTDQRGPGFVRIFPSNGTVDIGAFELQPPAVVAITVDWGVDSAPLFTASDGLRLLPAGRNTDLPWLGIDQFQITLNLPATLTAADVTVKGLKVKNYGPVAISGSRTSYTITLHRRIKVADRVTITIAAPNFVTYIRRLDVLPGDFDDNGVVNKRDVKDVRNEFHGIGGAMPTIFGDILGEGTVNAKDLKATKRLEGTRLPSLTRKHRV
jgi:Right handed beta helix region